MRQVDQPGHGHGGKRTGGAVSPPPILLIVLGLILGYVLVAFVNVAHSGWSFPYRPSWLSIVELSAIVLAVAVLAGWYPAREAAKLVVSDALEYE